MGCRRYKSAKAIPSPLGLLQSAVNMRYLSLGVVYCGRYT